MSAGMGRWMEWSDSFARLSKRERAITAFTIIVGGCFLIFNFLLEPWQIKAAATSKEIAAARAEFEQQKNLLALHKPAPVVDPDISNRQKLVQMKEQLAAVNAWVSQFESSLVPPSRMPSILEGMLSQNRGVQLVGFRSLPPQPLGTTNVSSPNASGAAKGDPQSNLPSEGIYEHGIELRLAGNYNDLLNYVAALERLPYKLMWANAQLTVETYPRNLLVLKVYTLSFDSNWLMV